MTRTLEKEKSVFTKQHLTPCQANKCMQFIKDKRPFTQSIMFYFQTIIQKNNLFLIASIMQHNNDTSFNILCNSSLASTTRSLSLLSTTNIRPCVFWKQCLHNGRICVIQTPRWLTFIRAHQHSNKKKKNHHTIIRTTIQFKTECYDLNNNAQLCQLLYQGTSLNSQTKPSSTYSVKIESNLQSPSIYQP